LRDLLANLLAQLRGTNRQQRLYLALVAVAALVAIRFGGSRFLTYRRELKRDIQVTAQRLAKSRRLLERADAVHAEVEKLRARYREAVAHLLPGDTPTLAAASLQDRISSLAAEHGVRLQTTQVLKDEAVGPFRQVSLRITASGELRDLAALLGALELGPLRVRVTFIELTRRGASLRRRLRPSQGARARTVSATLQVAGIVQGSAELPETTEAEQRPRPSGARARVAELAEARGS